MRIAVVGSGISGLAAAYRLRERHDVTIFEANGYLGGHTNTVDVAIAGEQHAVDTGFIVFNDRTYPHFCALLSELGVESRQTSMSFSVRCDRTGLEYNGTSLNGLFAQRRNLIRPRFYQMLRDILRFNREAAQLAVGGDDAESNRRMTVREYLDLQRYSREFIDHYLVPMGSAIWSSPSGRFGGFPIRFVAEFFHNHGLLSLRDRPTWRVVEGGSRSYVTAMRARFGRRVVVRLNSPVQSVRRSQEDVAIQLRAGGVERFDHILFACHADQALRMLADPSQAEREILSAFPYERNVALLHTDASMLPRNRRAWASWNARVSERDESHATVTYCMNILQQIRSRHVFCVSLNSEEFVDRSRVIGRFVYEHPVFNSRRDAAQARQQELLSVNRSSYCGAYWRNGFHEDGVMSALAVCRALENMERSSEDSRLRPLPALQPIGCATS
ncbi:MAG: NAD(P)/FAD-dependent oxidoreductase [Planctomycetaceae bacterium]